MQNIKELHLNPITELARTIREALPVVYRTKYRFTFDGSTFSISTHHPKYPWVSAWAKENQTGHTGQNTEAWLALVSDRMASKLLAGIDEKHSVTMQAAEDLLKIELEG
jgi:hypothetical protein